LSALTDSDAAARAPTQPAVKRRAVWPGAVYRWVLLSAAALALAVVVLGATVRLADAGLSCPDWPGCYGAMTVSGALATPPAAREQRWAGQPLDAARARMEMLHRYAAGSLGLCILGIVVLGRRWQPMRSVGPLLAGLVLMQALLGMWTVTSRLEPLVVTAHLLGGMTVLALLWWPTLRARDGDTERFVGQGARTGVRLLARTGLLLLVVQIGLGGWVAANHATLACQGFPTCNGSWWPAADVGDGYGPLLGRIADAGMSGPGRIAVQWVHRLGAAGLVLVLGTLALLATRARQPLTVRRAGGALVALLLTQVGLGAAIVLAGAPVALAAAHNAVAALLLILLVTLTWRLRRRPASVNRLSLDRHDHARRKGSLGRSGTEG
jgi:heme a synthase